MLRVGAALELFQAAALFHDDVMDDSDTRRGFPAAHRAFAGLHAGTASRATPSGSACRRDPARRPHPDGERAGVRRRPRPAAVARAERARAVFDLMRTEVTVGQYLDVLAQALPWGEDPAADEARAREVIRAKAARYSVEHPIVARRGARRRGRGRARAGAGRSACRWARRSSCATTCWACSATPRPPASRRGTTCGRASAPCSSPAPSLAPGPRRRRAPCELLRDRLGDRAAHDADVAASPTPIRATGAPTTSSRSSTTSPAGRSRSWTRAAGPSRRAAARRLAHAAVDRTA